jgi:Fe-S cluster assembly ATPase SufC
MRLLEIKLLLVAIRLAEPRTALILDEPDWGLSRVQAIAFVSAVVHVAHARGLPVILISHKPWWQTMARSVRAFHKEVLPPGGESLFRIRIDAAPAGGS